MGLPLYVPTYPTYIPYLHTYLIYTHTVPTHTPLHTPPTHTPHTHTLSNTPHRDYFKSEGIVTGGEYDSGEGCQPYLIPKCEHHTTGPYPKCGDTLPTPKCESKCQVSNTSLTGYLKPMIPL